MVNQYRKMSFSIYKIGRYVRNGLCQDLAVGQRDIDVQRALPDGNGYVDLIELEPPW